MNRGSLSATWKAYLKRNGADVRVAVTEDKGVLVFHGIAAGEYELTVSKDGFEPLGNSPCHAIQQRQQRNRIHNDFQKRRDGQK